MSRGSAGAGAAPLRILLNAIPLRAPRTGVGRVLTQLIDELRRLGSPGVELAFFDGVRVRDRPPRARSGGARPSGALLQRALHSGRLSRIYPPIQDRIFALAHPGRRHDVYHETNFLLPPFGGPVVVTVWDLSLRFHPESHPAGRVHVFEAAFARRLDRVDQFLVLSEAVRRELEGEFGVAPELVSVTPPGVDRNVFRPLADASAGPAVDPRLPRRFLLHVGTLEPRKNVELLLSAYELLPVSLRRDHGLVLAGPVGWKAAPLLRRLEAMRAQGAVIRSGYFSDRALADLYRRASALVFPSRYEGFGLPVLEAMACGTPVVCSDIPALAELAGDAAVRVPPGEAGALAEAVRRVLEEPETAGRLSAAGLERAGGYSRARCADLTLRAYRKSLER